ncbi:MAG: hypothetical protein GYA58_03430 [Anaerolineaceae bacterium]|nr:hypothetical protein [Anaerolineaceae bacterium]
MSDKPREWPNVARSARDLAAEAAVNGILALEPVVTGERVMTESERLRREAVALNSLQRIARALESVGAPTRVNEQ